MNKRGHALLSLGTPSGGRLQLSLALVTITAVNLCALVEGGRILIFSTDLFGWTAGISGIRFSTGSPASDFLPDLQLQIVCRVSGFKFYVGSPGSDFL